MRDGAVNEAVEPCIVETLPPDGEGSLIRGGDVGWCVRERGSDGRMRRFVVWADGATGEENRDDGARDGERREVRAAAGRRPALRSAPL